MSVLEGIRKGNTQEMKLSHSKLQTIINNPMDYYLNYKQGIKSKQTAPWFLVGSAVHWGLEHNTEVLDEFFKENGIDYKPFEQIQAEAMVHGFYYNKERIRNDVLKDVEDDTKLLKPTDEYHELEITSDLKSYIYDKPHNFLGIIDLLYLTDKGFILMDYKTSSEEPDFDKYLDQLYRYIFELNSAFKGVPVYKIGIINLIKAKLKRFANESEEDFIKRFRRRYEIDPHYINVHMFDPSTINKHKMDEYMLNLSREADFAETIDRNNAYFINYEHILKPYPSQYTPIYQGASYAYSQYKIKDTYLDVETGEIKNERDCYSLDMEVIHSNNVMNKYDLFKEQADKINNKDELFNYLEKNYIINNDLLENYWMLYNINKEDK